MKCDGTRAETRFRLSAKRTSPFKLAGASVQSTTGSPGVRISGGNDGYTMFRSSVKGTGYPIHSPVSPPLRNRVPSHFSWTLQKSAFLTSTLDGREWIPSSTDPFTSNTEPSSVHWKGRAGTSEPATMRKIAAPARNRTPTIQPLAQSLY